MALKAKSVELQEVLDLASLSVDGAAKNGGPILADAEARRLLDGHPDCRMPFEELRDTIADLATARGIAVEFGFPPRRNAD